MSNKVPDLHEIAEGIESSLKNIVEIGPLDTTAKHEKYRKLVVQASELAISINTKTHEFIKNWATNLSGPAR